MSYIEKLYSEAFDEGFEYAIEKLYSFAEERKKKTTEEDLEREAKHASNWKGFFPSGLLTPAGYGPARLKVKQSVKEGKSDDEIREEAHKEYDKRAASFRKLQAGVAGLGGALTGTGIHAVYGKEGSKLGLAGAAAAGALGTGALAYYGQKLIDNKLSKKGVDKNVDEAIKRRREMRESEGR